LSTRNRIKKILELGRIIKDENLEALALKFMANYFKINQNYKRALEYFSTSLKIYKQLQNQQTISEILLEIGILNQNMENWNESLKHFNESLKINNKLKNKFEEARLYNLIANSHRYQNNLKKSIDYYKKSLNISKNFEFRDFYEESLINLIEIFETQKNKNEYKKFFNKLIEFNSNVAED